MSHGDDPDLGFKLKKHQRIWKRVKQGAPDLEARRTYAENRKCRGKLPEEGQALVDVLHESVSQSWLPRFVPLRCLEELLQGFS